MGDQQTIETNILFFANKLEAMDDILGQSIIPGISQTNINRLQTKRIEIKRHYQLWLKIKDQYSKDNPDSLS
jgi:hypothetical protein